MLYDPKWEQQTKADPLSVAAIIPWLERQPANQNYSYGCNGHCLIAQYMKAAGFNGVVVGGFTIDYDLKLNVIIPEALNTIAQGEPRTFGAALRRARAAV